MSFWMVLEWAGLGLLCISAAIGTSVWLDRWGRKYPVNRVANLPEQIYPVFLFDSGRLVDTSDAGQALIERNAPDGGDLSDLDVVRAILGKRFQDLDTLDDVVDSATFAAFDSLDAFELLAERMGDIFRLEVRPISMPGLAKARRASALHKLEAEYDTLRSTMDLAPYPIWRINDGGEVNWYNGAYAELFHRTHGTGPEPGRRLFQSALDTKPTGSRIRSSISIPGEDNFFWYDVWITRHDGFRMFYAVDVGAVVNAETAQRNFVQTLTKTFAQLSIGLAVFDRNRQLVLFNPALIDLTALPAEFLSARPNLFSFFDRLRDGRMMPEPKNYANWRDQMAQLVAEAADGRYEETWSLPSGSIYKVRGRPHPDGAVAFLMEDITAEVTLTRRFRAELEMSQSVLDHVDDAIAVFAANGVLSLSNKAYRALWQVDPDASFADVTVLDASRDWMERSQPSPAWGDIRDFVAGSSDRSAWSAAVTLRTGEEISCSVYPVQDGATFVRFRSRAQPLLADQISDRRPADAI